MGGGNEQRVAINICLKAGVPATEKLVSVQRLMGMRI
jgi:hypothetical protein